MSVRLHGLQERRKVVRSFKKVSADAKAAADPSAEIDRLTQATTALGLHRPKRPSGTALASELFRAHTSGAMDSLTYRSWSALAHASDPEAWFTERPHDDKQGFVVETLSVDPKHFRFIAHASGLAFAEAVDRLVAYYGWANSAWTVTKARGLRALEDRD